MEGWRVRNEITDSGEVMDIRRVVMLGNMRPSRTLPYGMLKNRIPSDISRTARDNAAAISW